jgi:hypothetical protein
MIRKITILTATVLVLSGPAVFGQASAQAGGQASGSASAQASQSGAQASSGAAASASGTQKEQQGSLAAGTALNAQLSQPVDSKKAKAGDPVTAQTTESVKSEGKTVLPKGTKLVGHIARATARSKGDAESALAVQFDRAILKGGREIPLQASIQALAAAQTVAAIGSDDMQSQGGAGGGAGGSGVASGRGVLGGTGAMVGGAASGAASTVPRTVVGATDGVGSTVGATANSVGRTGTGLNAAGQLTSTSRGVFGLNGLSLASGATGSAEGSFITSAGKNVHLESGTQMLLVTQAASSTSAQR